MDEERFSFLPELSYDLRHTTYCGDCFASKVAPELSVYDSLVERAKEVLVFERNKGKETRLVPRTEDPVQVLDCRDYDETIMRLAFLAARANFNAIVDVSLSSKKIKDGSYSTLLWSGEGVPANVDIDRLPKNRSDWHHPS